LAHNKKGLFLSFRGALGIPDLIKNEKIENSCVNCHKPCLTACPVNALNKNGYDVAKCKSHITSHSGQECQSGCIVRKSCPIGSDLRLPEQSNFHMKSFVKDLV
jgi:epoxyqueuosine reductase